jgi:hypothetical protein
MIKNLKFKIIFISTVLVFFGPSFAFAITTGTSLSNAGGSSLKTGLLGWWTFDGKDMLNGAAVDKSGNGNTGTLFTNIATSTFYTTGQLGQAFKFDGVDDYVQTPSINGSSLTTISYSFWVKTKIATNITALSWGTNTACVMGTVSSGKMNCYVDGGSAGSATTATTINDGKWHHVVFTTSASAQTIYLDGAQSGTATETLSAPNSVVRIGRQQGGSTGYFNGSMDDARVYNRVLSASEVKQLYNLGASKLNSQVSNGGGDSLKTNLVAWWTFDGVNLPWTSVSAATALDSSGNGNTATLTGLSRLTSPVDGELGQALYFPRTTATNGVNTSGTIGSATSGYSFSFWFKEPNINLDTYYLFAWADLACRFGGRSTNTINCYADAGSTGSAFYSTTVNDNKWHHVVFTATDGGAGPNNQTLYVDGISRNTATETTNGYASRMWIASDVNGLSGNLKGTLDDFRFYSRVLSASEVKQLYNLGGSKLNSQLSNAGGSSLKTGLLGWWTFDGKNITNGRADDISGNSNNGTLVNIATSTFYKTGKIGQALNLDGINDTVTIDSIASSINKNEGTFSAWVYARSYTGGSPFQADGIIEVGSSASSNDGISLSPSSAANVSMNYRTGGVTTRATITNAPIRKWYHVAGTWNSSTLSIYLNGALYNSVANGTLTSATLNQARIGSDSLGTANQDYFDGYIDDVRIYSRALSASEVAQLSNLGK